MKPPRYRCLVLHAERLEVDEVWTRTRSVLGWLEMRGGHATLFVHPLSAIERGEDIRSRIRELLEAGHEIGQHTHFYADDAGVPISSLRPEERTYDDSDANVRRVLDRDLAVLRAAGAEPKGFTSGGWAIAPEVPRWLAASGFVYDCSDRALELGYESEPAAEGGGRKVPRLEDGIIRLPTTTTLRGALVGSFTRRDRSVPGVGFRYDMAYLHDYDLLRDTRRAATGALLGTWGRGPWRTAGELAALVAGATAPPPPSESES